MLRVECPVPLILRLVLQLCAHVDEAPSLLPPLALLAPCSRGCPRADVSLVAGHILAENLGLPRLAYTLDGQHKTTNTISSIVALAEPLACEPLSL